MQNLNIPQVQVVFTVIRVSAPLCYSTVVKWFIYTLLDQYESQFFIQFHPRTIGRIMHRFFFLKDVIFLAPASSRRASHIIM